ncbi:MULTISPECIES: carboxylate-amine ligase [Bradyrhizobium]|uniref:Putative glutamate--cysteine ligase 2 n=1 Tax=Bradyrhizobium aeschynomenes TaxID=2734909 RepID=A0ABX2CE84_9BRAD|nr:MULTISPECIES: carboxylate-amine ligase [Bradyrhizobium]NPU66536.1 carboxylate-amine ligase [Bradyrhizobium aeschynomenes]NPV20248.1 carboxylate-amine ligase [Bradyrhizobium aeschynomenes]
MGLDPRILEKLRLGLSDDERRLVIRSATGGEEVTEYSFGIEEEYFLADAKTLDVAIRTPDDLFEAANWSTGGQAMREMLQAQLEVATNVHVDAGDAREELKFLRREVASVAGQYGLTILACSTHPTATWRSSQPTPRPRYVEMMEDLRIVGQRNMLCGMHVHVQLPDPERRFAVMRAMIPYIPVFIALSASSPFWNSRETGLKGYRLAAYDELPRTGLPELFTSKKQYDRYVAALTKSGVMPDESHVWWAMRPSLRHPTLELRAPDVCTAVDDAVAVASLYRALARHLYLNPDLAEAVGNVERAIAVENKWRAQRYGTDCLFVTEDGPVTGQEILNRMIADVAPHAETLGCLAEVERCRTIMQFGSSADYQLQAYRESGGQLTAVTRWIEAATVSRAEPPRSQAPVEPAQ